MNFLSSLLVLPIDTIRSDAQRSSNNSRKRLKSNTFQHFMRTILQFQCGQSPIYCLPCCWVGNSVGTSPRSTPNRFLCIAPMAEQWQRHAAIRASEWTARHVVSEQQQQQQRYKTAEESIKLPTARWNGVQLHISVRITVGAAPFWGTTFRLPLLGWQYQQLERQTGDYQNNKNTRICNRRRRRRPGKILISTRWVNRRDAVAGGVEFEVLKDVQICKLTRTGKVMTMATFS